MENKITASVAYTDMIVLAEAAGREDLVDFCNTKIAQLAAKNEKTRERNAQKRAEGDALQATVLSILTEEPQTKDDICAAIGDETITPAKVVARMNHLIEAGKAVKETCKNSEGKKVVCYRLA